MGKIYYQTLQQSFWHVNKKGGLGFPFDYTRKKETAMFLECTVSSLMMQAYQMHSFIHLKLTKQISLLFHNNRLIIYW